MLCVCEHWQTHPPIYSIRGIGDAHPLQLLSSLDTQKKTNKSQPFFYGHIHRQGLNNNYTRGYIIGDCIENNCFEIFWGGTCPTCACLTALQFHSSSETFASLPPPTTTPPPQTPSTTTTFRSGPFKVNRAEWCWPHSSLSLSLPPSPNDWTHTQQTLLCANTIRNSISQSISNGAEYYGSSFGGIDPHKCDSGSSQKFHSSNLFKSPPPCWKRDDDVRDTEEQLQVFCLETLVCVCVCVYILGWGRVDPEWIFVYLDGRESFGIHTQSGMDSNLIFIYSS